MADGDLLAVTSSDATTEVFRVPGDGTLVISDANDVARTINLPTAGDLELDEVPLVARGTITALEVRTLNGTPIEILAAPGAGKYVQVHRIHWWLDYGSAAYDGSAAGEDLVAKYTDGSGAAVVNVVDHSGFWDATSDQHRIVHAVATEVTPVANAAIVAQNLVGEVYSAAGDSPVHYEVHYTVHDLAFSVA